jgi:hypothetical protein
LEGVMKFRTMATIVGLRVAGGLAVVGAIAVFLASVPPPTGTVSATDGTCNTVLSSDPASAGDNSIRVDDPAACDADNWVVINQGGATEECQQIKFLALNLHLNILYLYGTLTHDHSVGETVVEVAQCPTPAPTPTPTPAPTPMPTSTPTRAVNIPARSWANFAWTGNTATPEEVAHCYNDTNIAAMYRLDAETQMFERWFSADDGLSNMGDVAPFDVLLALNVSDNPATCMMPDAAALPERMLTIPARSWGNFAWTGNTASPEEVAHCYNDTSIAAMYRLDAETQMFERWFRADDGLSNMGDVAPFDVLLALNASDKPATCTMDGG